MKRRDEVTWFDDVAGWRAWLEGNHDAAQELWLGIRKAHVSHGVAYAEAVDEALCFGWIDGVTHGVDADGYAIRFTPRTARSIWSAVNLKKMEALLAAGRVHPAGLRAWEGRDPARAGLYSFEQDEVAFSPEAEAEFAANPQAWAWFQAQPPGYRRQATWWVTSAKKAETRARRLATLIDDSAHQRRAKPFAANSRQDGGPRSR